MSAREPDVSAPVTSGDGGWVSATEELPPEGRDDIQLRWSEVGSAKGGIPTHWRFKGKFKSDERSKSLGCRQ